MDGIFKADVGQLALTFKLFIHFYYIENIV